ncbi:SRPBCC domain-containing protein [Streptomyces sp. NPDC048389]|uniref:SRPBCC domain-containing protein n=1 Tax=Streptomyces sp. NPDC048389 TaxID=3154622 RepID=UPI003452199E
MEHEVFVPVPAETLRQALRDHARVARCVPGLQQDADESAGPLAGRLKVRVAGHTITYRGALRIKEQGDERGGAFAVEGEGAEVRGGGSVKLALTIRPAPTDGGTTVTFTGSSHAEGRLAELAVGAKTSAAQRLLDRFAEALAAAAFEEPRSVHGAADTKETGPAATAQADAAAAGTPGDGGDGGDGNGPEGPAADDDRDVGTDRPADDDDRDVGTDRPADEAVDAATDRRGGEAPAAPAAPDAADTKKEADADAPADASDADADADASADASDASDADTAGGSVFETPVPLPSLGPDADDQFDDLDDDPDGVEAVDGIEDLDELSGLPGAVPTEAAHARRTMIGRSAEEVDHAPPRGRYAPVPAPEAGSAGATLRWLAPAAALALASAVVVGRALRRRR